jgi:hypothetical protein
MGRVKRWQLRRNEHAYLLTLTSDEREYLARAAVEYSQPMSVIMRARVFFKGWRRDLDDLRASQNNTPIEEFDARRRRGAHELDVPVQRPSSQNGGREQNQASVPEGGSTPDR